MRVLVAGDYCQSGRVNKIITEGKSQDLFGSLSPVICRSDYSVVNFEFPIIKTDQIAQPIKKSGPNLKGTIHSVFAIKCAGFKCCTLANNHILDQGEQCCLDTKYELEKAGVDTVGVGTNIKTAEDTLYKKINGETLAIINCCEKEYSIASESTSGANPLDPIKQYYKIQEAKTKADYVLVIVHGGIEEFQLPTLEMKKNYRFFVDAGADAVVNHHQHCYSGYEVYKEKPIFYGLGNLCFDRDDKRCSIWNKGYFVILSFTSSDDKVKFELFPYSQCESDFLFKLEDDNSVFLQAIQELNSIIADDEQLKLSWNQFEKSNRDFYRPAITPFHSRLANALYRRNILPMFFIKKQGRYLFDVINCDSHRARFLAYLAEKNK